MPHQSLKLIPGVDQNKTPALNEAAISESNLIRFVPDRQGIGLVQKIGGWTLFPNNNAAAASAKIRALWAWADTNSINHLAYGTEDNPSTGQTSLVVYDYDSADPSSSTARNITPRFEDSPAETVDIVSTVNSNIFTITDTTTTGITNDDSVVILTPISVGGVILFGSYQCYAVSNTEYQILATDSIGNPAYALYSSYPNITNAVGSGTEVTFTLDDASYFPIGATVTVAGMNPAGYDGTYTVTASSPGEFVVASTTVTAFVSGGTATATGYGVVPIFTTTEGQSAVEVELPNHGFIEGSTFSVLVSTPLTSSVATTGASGTGTTATLTYSGGGTYTVGSTIVVAGVTPSGYNGTYTVTSSSAGSVSYASATTGAMTVAGTISATGPTLFGNYIVQDPITIDTFTITAQSSLNFDATVTMNGGDAYYEYNIGIGPPVSSTGYGVGGYGAGGYGTGSPIVSTTGTPISSEDWTLDNWGETLIACAYNGKIYEWNPTTNAITATAIPAAPTVNHGAFVAMPQRQIIAWGSTFTGIHDPLLIRWCEVNNYNVWTAAITNQAGSYRIPKGSRIIQCIQGPQQGLIWTDLGVWAMQYVGPPYVYQFNELGTGCGLIGKKAAGSINGAIYWMGQSQFFRLSNNGPEPVKCPIWDVIFQDLDKDEVDKIRIAPNSRFGEITWYYPTMSNGGEVSKYVKYNILLDQWDFGTLDRTAWINDSVLGSPIGAGSNKYIYQHETSTDAAGNNGTPTAINATFQTGYFALSEADIKMFVDQIWPDMKWGYYDGSQNATVNITLYATDYAGQTPIAYGPFTMTQNTTFITPRMRGRLVSIKIDSNDVGSFWRIGNIRYRIQPDGKF
jgi:hypothetical protein